MEVINIRRSIRKFNLKKLDKEDILQILKAGMQAPSARNQQPWEFIVVENQELINKLKTISTGSASIENAPCVIAILMKDNEELPIKDLVQQDLGACMENMLLKATDLKIGSLWVGIYPFENRVEAVQSFLNTKRGVFALMALGYPKDLEAFKFIDRFDESRISWR